MKHVTENEPHTICCSSKWRWRMIIGFRAARHDAEGDSVENSLLEHSVHYAIQPSVMWCRIFGLEVASLIGWSLHGQHKLCNNVNMAVLYLLVWNYYLMHLHLLCMFFFLICVLNTYVLFFFGRRSEVTVMAHTGIPATSCVKMAMGHFCLPATSSQSRNQP